VQVLLINPPIYDFTAYDFWLRPYGMLRVAGQIQHSCGLTYFDYLTSCRRDAWGRGRFFEQPAAKPAVFRDLKRHFRRHGKPRDAFRALLRERHFDLALIQTGMTYWYLGVKEVIDDLRQLAPGIRIILGGVYATLCPAHARTLEADLVIEAGNLEPLWRELPKPQGNLPYRIPSMGNVAAIKLTDGCPFRCTYCSVPKMQPEFIPRPVEDCLMEAAMLAGSGVRHMAFYDDALLFNPEAVLVPFMEGVLRRKLPLTFHTPNALNVRLMTPEIARLMVQGGCRSFFLGYESYSSAWMRKTGRKASADEFAASVEYLLRSGARHIVAYMILGHPDTDEQEVEASMRFAHDCGARILLSEFAPVPGTEDGEHCRTWTDMDEPLCHNKTAFTILRLGHDRVNRLKSLCRNLNARMETLR
jgi:pyruvate-formate lyase-activating enzyme